MVMGIERRKKRTTGLRLVKSVADTATSAQPQLRRFAPAVQVLTPTAPHIQERLQDIAMMGFRKGLSTEDICGELYGYARTLDYTATIGVQEVVTEEMPSFPGQKVSAALMLVDLKPKYSFADLVAEGEG